MDSDRGIDAQLGGTESRGRPGALPSHPNILLAPLFVLCATQFMLQLDLSIVNLGLESIQNGLGFSATALQWVATSYALTFGSLLMVGGRLGDLVGRRRLLVGGLAVFGLASLACGLATSPALLVTGRFVQGAAGAMLAPTVLAMITALYPQGRERTRAMAIWTSSVAVGGTTGVILGGVLAQTLGWRSIFLVNLPVVAVLLALARRSLPELRGDTSRNLDPIGAISLTLAIAALIFGVTSGEQHGFGSPYSWGALAVSALLATTFVVNELHVREPMVPLSFLAAPVRRGSALTMLLIGGVLASYMYFIALSLQLVLGFTPAQAGLCLVPTGFVMFGTSMLLSHRLIGRFGIKPVLLAGIGANGIGMLILSRIGPSTAYATEILPGLLINAVGIGLVFTSVSLGIMSDVSRSEMGIAGGLVPAAQQIGAAVILAILATIAAAVTSANDGSLAAGYRTGFLVAFGIVALAALAVARTPFRSPGPSSAEPAVPPDLASPAPR